MSSVGGASSADLKIASEAIGSTIESGEPSILPRRRATIMITVLLMVSILNNLDRQIPLVLAESIKKDLGLSDTQLGLMGGLTFALCYSTLALPLARLADRWSPKKVIAGSVLTWSLLTAFGGLA